MFLKKAYFYASLLSINTSLNLNKKKKCKDNSPIVQNGKFSAAAWLLVKTLKNVDFLDLKIQKQVNISIKLTHM